MQGAHARPIVAQLTPGDPRPIAPAQNVPAERSGIECRESQPPSRQPAMLPPPLLAWLDPWVPPPTPFGERPSPCAYRRSLSIARHDDTI
eukprot:scaffold84614_cov66-Phaeocystis_antarctica.AAC.1